MLGYNDNNVRVSRIYSWDNEVQDCTCENLVNIELGDLIAQGTQYDYVIAPDEWLTFAQDEQEQIQKINQISKFNLKVLILHIVD